MAVISVKGNLNVEKVYVTVTCPACEGTVRMKLKAAMTRKVCPKCNRLTYVIIVAPMRGYIALDVYTVGADQTPAEYVLLARDVETEPDTGEDEPEEHDRDEESEF